MRFFTSMMLIGLVIALSGCVSQGRHQNEISTLEGQLAQTEAALKAQIEQNKALEAQLNPPKPAVPIEPYQGSTYRTPAGFELPAMDIQKALKGAGYYSGAIDGKMGPDSREALRNFQRDKGLTPDGVCGKQTWAKLKEHLN